MKNFLKFFVVLVIGMIVAYGLADADSQVPAKGGVLPDIVFSAPESIELQEYLGVTGKKTFKIPEIRAEIVLIEIFSMY